MCDKRDRKNLAQDLVICLGLRLILKRRRKPGVEGLGLLRERVFNK